MAIFREYPPAWWGWPWRLPRPLSVAELIAAGSLDARVAALLWVALERRTSVLVAAGPNGAGKTVTLSALLDFLPPTVQRVHLQGMAEDFAFVTRVAPTQTYLLCNEISDHLPIYLWGRRVQRLFALLGQGFALGATLHADSLEETLAFLRAPPLSLPDALLAEVPLVITLAVVRRGGETLRRIATVHLLENTPGGLAYQSLAIWDRNSDTHRDTVEAHAIPLARRLGVAPEPLLAAIDTRACWLGDQVQRGALGPAAVRAALAAYRGEAP